MQPAARAWLPALLVLGFGLLALFALFRDEARAAVTVWTESTAFGHCFLVLPIAAWLAWERRHALIGLSPRPRPGLAALAVLLVVVWFVAERLGLMEGRQLIVLALVWLLVITVLGVPVARAMAAPLAYLVFLVPFGAFLVPDLQNFTSRFIGAGLHLLDIPHVVTATLIETPEGNFEVAEACAGLRFLIAAIAFGVLYALMFYRDTGRRVVFIAICIVVPVLANGVRALGIVVLGHIMGDVDAMAVDHVVYGWLFFTVVIVLLLLLGLPFRQDGPEIWPGPGRIPMPAPLPRLLAAAIVVMVLAAIGPAAAAALQGWARADSARLAGAADRLLSTVALPAGCAAAPSQGSTRRVTCDATVLNLGARVFGGRDGPIVLTAWRDATDGGKAEDMSGSWLTVPDADWRLIVAHRPEQTSAAALWLGGAPAPRGLALRARMALDGFGAGGAPVVLATITTPSTDPAAREVVARLARAASTLGAMRP